MTFVQLLVEDEFGEDHTILHLNLHVDEVLSSQDTLHFLIQEIPKHDKPTSPKHFFTSTQDQKRWKKLAVACLQSFVAYNWFRHPINLSQDISSILLDFFTDIKSYLEVTDECYFNIQHLPLLALSKFVLGKIPGASIWKARYIIVHQIVLSLPNTSLYLELKRTLKSFEGFLTDAVSERSALLLKTQVAVELAQAFLFYTDVGSSKPLIDSVVEFSGVKMEYSGALGTRTRYQEKATSQLFLKITREGDACKTGSPDSTSPLTHPRNIALEDDVLLNQVHFTDGKDEDPEIVLSGEEQVMLLAVASHMKRMSSYSESDSPNNEELLVLLEHVIAHTTVRCIRFEALRLRSMIERKSTKRMDRSMVQLNHLVDSYDEFETERLKNNGLLVEDMKYFYATLMTPKWTTQKDLADVLCNMGCTKSALDIYLQLRSWEELVHCYQVLDRKNKAEDVVREQIAVQGETPFLLCLLADATNDHTLCEKAWDVSGKKYFRAKRDLGNYYFKRKDYEGCKQHYQESLAINSLQIGIWQRLGFAALDTEDYQLAVKAYRRFVEFEPDMFEAWNNLAKAYIKLGKKNMAYSTLQEAIKCNFEQWRLWENYLMVSLDVGSFDEVIRSWHRLIDLKGKYEDDAVIDIFITVVLNDVKDMNGNLGSKITPRLLQLLGRIKGTAYSSFTLWTSYAKLMIHEDKDLESVVDLVRRANRVVAQTSGWDKEPAKVKTALDNIHESVTILLGACGRDQDIEKRRTAVSSTRLTLESLVRSAEMALSSWDPAKVDLKPLTDSLEQVKMSIGKLNDL